MSLLEEVAPTGNGASVARVVAPGPEARTRAGNRTTELSVLYEQARSLAHVGTWISDVDVTGSSFWSSEMYAIFGIEDGTPMSVERCYAAVHPDDVDLVRQTRKNVVEGGQAYDVQFRIRRPNGEVRWIHAKATLVRDGSGEPQRLLGVVQDITGHRHALDELLASEQRYRRMLETTTVGVWVIAADGETTSVNARMAEMLGYEPHELLGRHPLEVVAPDSVERSRASIAQQGKHGPEQLEVELLRRDGTPIHVLVENSPIFDANGAFEGALAVVVDVTARKRAEEQLRLSEARIRLLLDSTGEALYGLDLDGRCVFANAACVRMLGYQTENDLLGKEMHALSHHKHRSGAEYPAGECRIHAGGAVESGIVADDEVLWRADGTSFDVEQRSFPIRVDGVRVGSVVSFVDITSRRRAEGALRQAQKMEAIGRLAGGVAHDFNNLLCIILTYTSFLLDGLQHGDPMRADVEEIRAAGERAAELTRHLLAFSRRQVLEPTVLDVDGVFVSVEKMLRRLLGEDIALSFTATDAPRVHADRGQLEQVLMNLAVNARDAMPEGGTLAIAASVVEIDAAQAAHRDGVAPGEYVLLSVSDTGCGMSPEVCARIFEPFFTTKGAGKGTGLGLSTVFGVVKQSGGTVSVSSELGRGTKFEILLPHTRAEAKPLVRARSGADVARGDETILLVEDDERVRTLVQTILRSHGYEVIDASNAGEALLVCEQHTRPIHLLLTDVVLPRMSGRQLAERVAPLRPGMRVLYVSGYTDDEVFHRGVSAEGFAFLPKPFTPASVVRKVREVLDADRAIAIAC